MAADRLGVDFYEVHRAITRDYPRMAGFPRAGFAAGPCLPKDTLQLAAFDLAGLPLGLAAMAINEGLPKVLVEQAKAWFNLATMTTGILGMASRESPTILWSPAYKLRKVLSWSRGRCFARIPISATPISCRWIQYWPRPTCCSRRLPSGLRPLALPATGDRLFRDHSFRRLRHCGSWPEIKGSGVFIFGNADDQRHLERQRQRAEPQYSLVERHQARLVGVLGHCASPTVACCRGEIRDYRRTASPIKRSNCAFAAGLSRDWPRGRTTRSICSWNRCCRNGSTRQGSIA